MRLLLDTHLVLWWLAGSSRLPAATVSLVDSAEVVFVSRASLWEVAIKISIGKLKVDIKAFVNTVGATGFEWLEIKSNHLVEVATLETFDDHRDPFDRLLVSQSRTEPLRLLTADRRLSRYGQWVEVL